MSERTLEVKFRDKKEDYGLGTMIEVRDLVLDEKKQWVAANVIRLGVLADKTYTKQARHRAAKDGLVEYLRHIASWLANENSDQGQNGKDAR